MAGDIAAVGRISRLQATEVGQVLAERQLPFDVHAGQRLILVELRSEPIGLDLVLGGGRGGPPVAQPSLRIELTTFVVEAGNISPPFGLNMFILKTLMEDVPMSTVFRGVMPFFIAALVGLALCVAFPEIVTWLPDTMPK